MNKIIILTISLLIQLYSNAQSNVNKDPRIDALIKLEGQVVPPATSPQIVGYRIQLFFDDSKTAVDEARARFLNSHPKVDTYVVYNAPNYFLKAGDFRSQMDAEKIKATVDAQFPTAFIIKEKVNLPRVD
jgi:hypothetical protein